MSNPHQAIKKKNIETNRFQYSLVYL
jgi:hypothetical protein